MYAMMSALSFLLLIPANAILVPGTYFFGFSRNLPRVSSSQTMAAFLFALEYAKPGTVPEVRPYTPYRDGPVELTPFWALWH